MTNASSVPTTNKKLIAWVEEVRKLTTPKDVYWCDGSQEEYDAVMNIYNTFTKKLHEWVRVEKDRKELLTAIHLIIYYLRDTDKKA